MLLSAKQGQPSTALSHRGAAVGAASAPVHRGDARSAHELPKFGRAVLPCQKRLWGFLTAKPNLRL